jgi:small-conductance mechanosensitive channel
VLARFVLDVSIVAAFMDLAGGIVLIFASINTIRTAIGGIMVMISKPFKVGEHILFNKQFADIIIIDLIYTRMKTAKS